MAFAQLGRGRQRGMIEMQLDEAGKSLIERHRRWWAREETLVTQSELAPLGDLWVPLADGTDAQFYFPLTPELLDFERMAGPEPAQGPLGLMGDRFRTTTAFGWVPWVEAIVGAAVEALIQAGSMRTLAFVETWDDWQGGDAHRDEAWYALLLRLTEALVARSGGRHAVVAPTMRGPSDLAEAVMGPELMCFSIYDHPDELCGFLEEVTDVFIEVLHALLARIPPVAGGYVSPFGIWAPGTVVRTQCDASALLSAKHYATVFLPHDVRICESVDYSFIHLHSCSLHTVDGLLEVELPHAIQVTLEAEPSGPPLAALVPIFHKILEVKPLLIEGHLSDDEVSWLLDTLPAGGLAITAWRTAW